MVFEFAKPKRKIAMNSFRDGDRLRSFACEKDEKRKPEVGQPPQCYGIRETKGGHRNL
jgi:hypothetical protein